MDKMLVGIDYTQDGSRTIGTIEYGSLQDEHSFKSRALDFKSYHDEAYIVDFNPNCVDFINEIVLKGCRV